MPILRVSAQAESYRRPQLNKCMSRFAESYHQPQLNKYMTRFSLLNIIFHGCIRTEKTTLPKGNTAAKNAHATSIFIFQIPVYLHN